MEAKSWSTSICDPSSSSLQLRSARPISTMWPSICSNAAEKRRSSASSGCGSATKAISVNARRVAASPSSLRQKAATCRTPRSARGREASPCFCTSMPTSAAWSMSIRADFKEGVGRSPPAVVLQPIAAASAAVNARGRNRKRMGADF